MSRKYKRKEVLKPLSPEERQKVEWIYQRYEEAVFRIAIRYLKDHHLAEDCRNEVMYNLAQNLDKVEPVDGKSAEAYIYRATCNMACDILRKKRREIPKELYDPVFERGKSVELEALKGKYGLGEELDVFLESLDEVDRRIVRYKYIEDLTYRQIAKKMGLSLAAAEKRGKRLKDRLENEIKRVREIHNENET